MVRTGPQDSSAKSQLVLEICAISTAPIGCPHRRYCVPANSHFIDWYRLLGVPEDAGMEVIRKRYHTLALQVHPDKNKHHKAEIAFKLVSEAYACLSDGARRKAFHLEKCRNFCIECNGIPCDSRSSPEVAAMDSRTCRVMRAFKDIWERFKEETRVIENCLRTNSLSRKESQLYCSAASYNVVDGRTTTRKSQRESPIFNPSDYLFHGYPHLRSRVSKRPENLCHFQRPRGIPNYGRGRERYQTPIFETVTEIGTLKSKPVCIRS
ncbi:hypothetical protein SLE2022_165290 [Rubroshorea leprosula]